MHTIFLLKNLKRPLRRPRHRWKDNIKMDLKEIGCKGVEWMHMTKDKDQWQAFENMVLNLWVL
jgi:hypothetical protein